MNTVSEEIPIKYFAMIPHIIYELGLDSYDIALYCLLKRISCENSFCTYSNENLAKMLKISVAKLKRIKKKLSEHFPLINSPLIICNVRNSKEKGSETTEIKIVNIWPQGNAYFEQKKEEKKQAQKIYTGSVVATPPGSVGAVKNKPGFKKKKEINKEKNDTILRDEESNLGVQKVEDSEVKPPISFPFSFSKEDMGKIHESVKELCPDKKTLIKVLKFAETNDFWNVLLKTPHKVIKNFKTIYEQAKKVFVKEDLIAKRRQFAKGREFTGNNGYALSDHEKLTIVSGGYTEFYFYNKECDYWTNNGLGADDGN